MSNTETNHQRVACTLMDVDEVNGVPFVNVSTDPDRPLCVSGPMSGDQAARLCSIPGYQSWDGDTVNVDRLITERGKRTQAEADVQQQTIEGLIDSNLRLSADLTATRQKLNQVTAADGSGGKAKIAELTDQLQKANALVLELQNGGGGDDGFAAKVAELQRDLNVERAKVAELEAQVADGATATDPAALIAEIRRIAELPQGFKKELGALLETIDGPGNDSDSGADDDPEEGQ